MLLIGQPKAASTSLAFTIGKIAGLQVRYGIPKNKDSIKCEGFDNIQRYHNNMIIRSEKFFDQVVRGRKTIFKEHILPTQDHLKKLNKYKEKIVILLREPEHTIDAYNRIGIMNIDDDVFKFHEKWLYWKSVHKNVMIVYYRDLILHYKPTIRKVLKWFGLPIPKELPPLAKRKYTGVGEKRLCS